MSKETLFTLGLKVEKGMSNALYPRWNYRPLSKWCANCNACYPVFCEFETIQHQIRFTCGMCPDLDIWLHTHTHVIDTYTHTNGHIHTYGQTHTYNHVLIHADSHMQSHRRTRTCTHTCARTLIHFIHLCTRTYITTCKLIHVLTLTDSYIM